MLFSMIREILLTQIQNGIIDTSDNAATAGTISIACADGEVYGYSTGTWGCAPPGAADNLGNHIAGQDLVMGVNWVSNDGDSEGIGC